MLEIARYVEKYEDVVINVYGSGSEEIIIKLNQQKNIKYHGVISYDYLLFAFQFFKGYKRFVDVLLKANLISVLQTGLNYYMDRYLAGTDADMTMRYQMYYYAGGICNLFTIWISRGMQESCEEMAQIIYDRFNHPSFAHNKK